MNLGDGFSAKTMILHCVPWSRISMKTFFTKGCPGHTALGVLCNRFPGKIFVVHMYFENILKVDKKENCVFLCKPMISNILKYGKVFFMYH